MKKILAIAALALVIVYVFARTGQSGVELTLNNAGPDTLRAVIVEVTGRSYNLGDMPHGSSKTITLNATGDSHIELLFSNGRRLVIDCYFQPGYDGSIKVIVTSQAVVAIEDQITSSPYF
ncbi:MAG: hypothetical protein V4723_04295 [Pseudomonadota bacterium]